MTPVALAGKSKIEHGLHEIDEQLEIGWHELKEAWHELTEAGSTRCSNH
jgi:hypothetical protein